MDSLHRVFINCPSFPPELWACITHYLAGEHLGRLKLTGSAYLWFQLSAPRAVTSVILGKEDILFKKWPAFVNEFPSLQELDISIEDDPGHDFWQPRLENVPKYLRKLSISANHLCIDAFFSQEDGAVSSLIEHTPLLNSLSVTTTWSRKRAWQAYIPPNLTFLKVLGLDADSTLPTTLLHLDIDYIYDKMPIKGIQLPPCIETVAMKHITHTDICSTPGLLSISSELAMSLTPQEISSISRNVTVLHGIGLDKKSIANLDLGVSPSELFPCPPYLTELTATDLPIECWSALPKTLKYLKLSRVHPTKNLQANAPFSTPSVSLPIVPTQLLPRSITHLILEFSEPFFFHASPCPSPSDAAAPHPTNAHSLFPPLTTHLRLHSAQLSVEATKQLPTSLFALSLRNLDESVIDYLPKSLTVLKSYAQEPSPSFIHRLPKSLTELRLWKPTLTQSWFDPVTGIKRKVGDFTSNRSNESALENCSPPAYLKKLEIEGQADFSEGFVCRYGRHLEELHLQSTFSNESIPRLSRHLIELVLNHSIKITGECFPDLPSLLIRLEMTSAKEIFDGDIKHLPRQLQHLKLSSAIHLTNDSLKDFPRLLRLLDLTQNEHITLEGLAGLPPKSHLLSGEHAFYSVHCSWNN